MAIEYMGAGVVDHTGPDQDYVLDPTSFATAEDLFAVNIVSDPDVLNDPQTWATVPGEAIQVVAPTASNSAGEFSATTVWLVPWTSGTLTWILGDKPYEYDGGDGGALTYLWFRGVDLASPLGTTGGTGGVGVNPYSDSTGTSHVVGAVTTAVDGCYIFGGLNISSGSQTFGTPAGWTNRTNSTVRDGLMSTKGIQATAGTTGTVTFTHGGSNRQAFGYQMGLRPAAAGPATPTLVRQIVGALT